MSDGVVVKRLLMNTHTGAPSEVKSELSAELSISSIVMVLLPSL